MRIRSLSYATWLILPLALAACGGSTPPPENPDSAEAKSSKSDADDESAESGGDDASSDETGGEEGRPSGRTKKGRSHAAKGAGSKITQCNALIGVINEGVRGVQAAQEKNEKPTDQLRRMADTMEAVGQKSDKVKISLPDLLEYRDEYSDMAKDVSVHARAMADAADKKDIPTMNREKAALDRAVKREDPLVDAINNYCQAN